MQNPNIIQQGLLQMKECRSEFHVAEDHTSRM